MSHSPAKTWLLEHNKAIPALDVFHQEALEALHTTTASLADVADIISLDPGMSIALFEKVNVRRNSIKRPRLDSIHSVLGLLGMTAVIDFVTNFQPLSRCELGDDVRQAYQQLISQSFHLMHQADQFFELQGMNNNHQTQIATLLYNIGELHVCLFDFKQYQRYQQTYNTSQNASACAESIFGFSFEELGLLLSDKKYLPSLARATQLRLKNTERKAHIIQMAADITQQTENGWQHPALVKSITTAAEYLNTPIDSLRKKLLDKSLEAARRFPIDDVFPAIAKAILLPHIDKPTTKAAAKPLPNQPSFAHRIGALIKHPDTTQAEIIKQTINQLFDQPAFSRVILMLLSNNNRILSTRVSKGLDTRSALLKLQIDMTQSGLIQSLLTKPQSLWMTPANFKRHSARLPGTFRASYQSQNFFMMSIFIANKPIGLIFCDGKHPLNDALYQIFKSNLSVASTALSLLSQRSKKVNSESIKSS